MKRRIIVTLVFVLAIGLCGGLVWFNFFRDKMITQFFANMQRPPVVVTAVDAGTREWTPGISAIGTARAENGVELAVQISGLVREIRFNANDKVKKGDLLVQIDDQVERADLIDADAAVKLAEANLERATTLKTRGFNTETSYDQAVAQLATARSRLQRIQAVIDQKALKAPFPGVIGISRINPGQYLQVGTQVATLQNLDTMKVDFTVPEQAATNVKIGQPVRFGATEGDLSLKGKIIGIDPRVDPQTRLVSVQAGLDESNSGIVVPGQFLRVRIDLPAERNILTVPQTAVVSSLYGDYVFVAEDNTATPPKLVAKQLFVKVGRREGPNVEIISGVESGQKVITSGQNKIQAGAPVKIDNSIDLSKIASGRSERNRELH